MAKLKQFFYNFVIYPVITLLDFKNNILYSQKPNNSVLDRCNNNIIRDNMPNRKEVELCKKHTIKKGWILTNNKNNYSIVYDSHITNSIVMLKLKEVVNLLFYGLVMYISGRIIILSKSTSIDNIVDALDKNFIDRVLLYYPENFNIFYQIYTKSPSIPVQIMITSNKNFDSTFKPITSLSEPIIPNNYNNFEDFITVVIKSWTKTSSELYLSEKRFIDSRMHN